MRGFIFTAIACAAMVGSTMAATGVGRYEKLPITLELGNDGRKAKLVNAFDYIDSGGVTWAIPAGIMVDGASIPQPFWSVIGGPWEGKYRNASIVHDHYCDTKSRPWKKVHRVFYDAMITSGVDETKAKVMYFAVYAFGPRWGAVKTRTPSGLGTMENKTVFIDNIQRPYDDKETQRIVAQIEKDNLSLEQIEQKADASAPPVFRGMNLMDVDPVTMAPIQ